MAKVNAVFVFFDMWRFDNYSTWDDQIGEERKDLRRSWFLSNFLLIAAVLYYQILTYVFYIFNLFCKSLMRIHFEVLFEYLSNFVITTSSNRWIHQRSIFDSILCWNIDAIFLEFLSIELIFKLRFWKLSWVFQFADDLWMTELQLWIAIKQDWFLL